MLGYATTKGISPHGYTLLGAARDIYASGDQYPRPQNRPGDFRFSFTQVNATVL